jgi:DNA polymerase III subunit gamma/tau
MSYVVLALKWRPQTFEEVAGQDPIAQTLKNAIEQQRTAHAYLFTGPRGVGKTTTARILAKALNCEKGPTPTPDNTCDSCREITSGRSLDVLEIDGASNRGIDDIRELRESVRYAPAGGRAKVYIIDEVHMLTTDAFNALLKTLEEPPPHVVFVLATTEPLKVPATIVSRCQRFDFSRLRMRDTLNHLQKICAAEKINVTEDGLSLIARRAEGSMRDALTLLDQVIASGRSPLDGPGVAAALGISGRDLYFELSEAMLAQDAHRALVLMTNAYNEGQNLQEVGEELVGHLRNLLMLSEGTDLAELVEATDTERERYREQAGRARAGDLIRQLHIAIDAAVKMRRSAFPRVILEVALAEICLLPRAVDLASVLRTLPEGGGEAGGGSMSAAPVSARPMPTAPTMPRPSTRPTVPVPTPAPASKPAPAPGPASSPAPAPASKPTPGTPPVSVHTELLEPPPFEAPASVAPSMPAVSPIATVVAGDIAATWPEVLRQVGTKKRSLAAALKDTQAAGEENGFILIRFPADAGFQKSAVDSAENKPVLQGVIREVYGRPLGYKIDQTPADPKAAAHNASSSAPADGADAAPGARQGSPRTPARGAARSNMADIERIAKHLDGDVTGPS